LILGLRLPARPRELAGAATKRKVKARDVADATEQIAKNLVSEGLYERLLATLSHDDFDGEYELGVTANTALADGGSVAVHAPGSRRRGRARVAHQRRLVTPRAGDRSFGPHRLQVGRSARQRARRARDPMDSLRRRRSALDRSEGPMCKKEIESLLEISQLSAVTAEQRALVVEACLGYYILNEPPEELVLVVNRVSRFFIEQITQQGISMRAAISYIASTDGKFFGVLEEVPSDVEETATEQVLRALSSKSIAVQINAHRTLLKFVNDMYKEVIAPGKTGNVRKAKGGGTRTDRYGAIDMMGTLSLNAVTQVHVPASTQYFAVGPSYPYDLPSISGQSGTTEMLLKVVKALNLSESDSRWYCLGILGFLLAPGAHSLHEVAITISANNYATYLPCYRYCGFLGFEMQRASWYRPMLLKVGNLMKFEYWGDLQLVCYELVKSKLLPSALWELVFTFLEIPFLTADMLPESLQQKLLE
jgi:hypothetical protein